jgi:hypothetical protein
VVQCHSLTWAERAPDAPPLDQLALNAAIGRYKPKCVYVLLDYGKVAFCEWPIHYNKAHRIGRPPLLDADALDADGYTSLQFACIRATVFNEYECVRILLNYNHIYNVNGTSARRQQMPLMIGVY